MIHTGNNLVHHTLANGLRVVHSYDPHSAMVAVNVLYDVGSRDERRSLTGIAHLFEHLMFGGSANVSSFDGELQAAGGKSNAWTSTDFTNFYDILPAQNIETAFHLESDRMLRLDFGEKPLQVQRSVVVEEFKQTCLNRPYGDLMHHIRRLAYAPEHSYSWPTIGLEPSHIQNATQDDIRTWFYSHYAPNNAVLSVVGGVKADEAFALAEKWFSGIERRNVSPRVLPAPGFPLRTAEETVYAPVPEPMVVMIFPMDIYGTERYHAADAITDLLSVGRTARFRHNLLHGPHKGLFASVDASVMGSEHEGLLLLMARLATEDSHEIDRACSLMLDECRRLAEPGGVDSRELERMRNNFESTFFHSHQTNAEKAADMALAVYHGEDFDSIVERRRALSPDAICAEASRLFLENPYIILKYLPEK